MAIHRLPRPPMGDGERAWQKWYERITQYMPITGRIDKDLNPSSVSANTTEEQTFTVEGARDGDGVIVTKPSHTAGIGIGGARVSATDEIAITFINPTGSNVDPGSETYRIWLIRWS